MISYEFLCCKQLANTLLLQMVILKKKEVTLQTETERHDLSYSSY